MGFFFTEARREAPAVKAPRGPIPIEVLGRLGCKACPRDKARGLKHPKLEATGDSRPDIYLLGPETSDQEDKDGVHWNHRYGDAVLDAFPARVVEQYMRFGHLIQCADPQVNAITRQGRKVDDLVAASCKSRVVADIEHSQPLVVVGVGDAALKWATGLSGNAIMFRGRLIPVKFGSWTCWYYCLTWPNYAANKNNKRRSEHQLVLEHDVARLMDMLRDGLPKPVVETGPYDAGLQIITGHAASDIDKLAEALDRLAREEQVGIDIETNALRPYTTGSQILTAAVGTRKSSVGFALDHHDGWRDSRKRKMAWSLFGDYLLNSGRKVAHHLGFEMEWFAAKYGPSVLRLTEWGDSMAMAHTVDERRGTKSLEDQTVLMFGFNLKEQSPVNVRLPQWWLKFDITETLRYNGMDSIWCDALARAYEPVLAAEASQWDQYQRKVRSAPTLVLTQALGLHPNQTRAVELDRHFSELGRTVEARIAATPEVKAYQRKHGRPFNPGNTSEVLELMSDLGRPEIIRQNHDGSTKETTDEEALAAMPVDEVPSAPLILELRGVDKLRSTYLGPIISGKIISDDGLVHAIYSQFVAVSSRLAAEDPAVQNWPKRKHREIRGCIWTPYGLIFVSVDLGQIEFRVIGMASGDEELVRACWTDYDVHGFWAQRMVDLYPKIKDWIVTEFSVDWDEKGLKTLRQESKNGWVFPQFFGASLNSIAPRLHLPERIAQRLDGEFWDTFRGAKQWQNRLIKSYEKNLYVETLDGHRRRGAMTRNEIINHPIQGTAARINVDAMNALSEYAQINDDWEVHPVLNVHDDLTERMRPEVVDEKMLIIAKEMCRHRHPWVNVPIVAEVSIGSRWDELKEIKKFRSDVLFGLPNPYAKR